MQPPLLLHHAPPTLYWVGAERLTPLWLLRPLNIKGSNLHQPPSSQGSNLRSLNIPLQACQEVSNRRLLVFSTLQTQPQPLLCPLQSLIASPTSLGLASCLLSQVAMVGMILPLLLWPRMPFQDKLLQRLLQLPSLLSNSSPPPQCSSLLLPLPGGDSSLSSNREDTNSSSSRSSHLLPTNLQDGQVSSLLSSSSLPRLLQLISSRHLSLPNLQLQSRLSIKSSKMLWRASDQNVNKEQRQAILKLGGSWRTCRPSWISFTIN